MLRNRWRPSTWLLCCIVAPVLLVAACGSSDDSDHAYLPEPTPTLDLSGPQRVSDLLSLVRTGNREQIREQTVEIDAWITPPPGAGTIPATPPRGCPVVPEKQDWLTDDPVLTQFEVAGAVLPNRLEGTTQYLRLVVPYQLGFIDIPERARLRGRMLDPGYAGCPQSDTLFILDEIVEVLPADNMEANADLPDDWGRWSAADAGIVLELPGNWQIEERDAGGAIVQVRLLSPDGHRPIQLRVTPGETFWNPDQTEEEAPPPLLHGDRIALATAGPARARLIDDSTRAATGERELRIVFNHQENTVALWTIIQDGPEIDRSTLAVFSEIALRLRLRGDVTISDPMDPLLSASEELGDGPYLTEADARYLAVGASGLTGAEAVDADLVSEREARMVTTGACRDFDGRPDGVWLVTVDGVLPTGQQSLRLVYLDAVTGTRLCQTEAPGA
jgi:hypothetical protein